MKRMAGFTLVELLVVFAIVGILAATAIPSFRTLLVKRAVDGAADSLVSDLRFARSEAMKRANFVTVCSSSNGTSCTGTAAWKGGWIVFVDLDKDGVVDAGEEILRVQSAYTNIASISSVTPGSDRVNFIYQPIGWGRSINQTFIVTPSGSVPLNSTRLICISNQGRAGLKTAGATACS